LRGEASVGLKVGASSDLEAETPHRKPRRIPFIPALKGGAFWCWGKIGEVIPSLPLKIF